MKKEELDNILGRDTGPIEYHLAQLATEDLLPVAALGACLIRADEACPLLVNLVDNVNNGMELNDDQAQLLFRGLHVMGGARYQPCFPSLLAFLRLPGEELEDLLGDAISLSLPKIVIGTFDGNASAFFDLILNHKTDEFVCGALLYAAAYLTWEGRIAQTDMQTMLQDFYAARRYPKGSFAWYGWQMAIALLGLQDFVPLLNAAHKAKLTSPEIASPREIDKVMQEAVQNPEAPERFTKENLGYLDDVYEELRWTDEVAAEGAHDDNFDHESSFDPIITSPYSATAPITNPMRNIGRNDLCPCGSGKKYKKCCLGTM